MQTEEQDANPDLSYTACLRGNKKPEWIGPAITVIFFIKIADAKWTQHATGIISIEFGDAGEMSNVATVESWTESSIDSTRYFDTKNFYSSMQSSGISYGPSFRNTKTVIQSSKCKLSETIFSVADISVPKSLPSSHILHPTRLDSVIQAVYTTLSEAQLRQGSLKVPQSISELWVSNAISREPCHQFKAHSSRSRGDAQSVQSDILVVDDDDEASKAASQILKMEGLVLMSIGARNADPEQQQAKRWEKDICNKLKWAPDMSLATTVNLHTLKQQFCSPPDPKEADVVMDLRRICIYFILDALTALTKSEIE